MLISGTNLEVTFRVGPLFRQQSLLAVAGVSFDIAEKETFALVGESGSGKTTLARAINGLQAVSAGQIHFDGGRIDNLSAGEMKSYRQQIAMIFQDPVGSLSPRMTVGDLITEPFKVHSIKCDEGKEVQRLLSLVGLPSDFSRRYPHQLSGGQARRVGVARAIALNPRLIIADEPTAGLDVSVQGEVLNRLKDLKGELGLSMLIITHNLHVVRRVADRMAVMYLGRFVEVNQTSEIFRAPAHPYTASLLSANPEPDPDSKRDRISLPADVPSLMARPGGCEFHTRCPWVEERCCQEAPSGVSPDNPVTCHFPLKPGAKPPKRPAGRERMGA
ncbi:MAG: ABC transporter ATP-binding protein [Parvularculales bacterium]